MVRAHTILEFSRDIQEKKTAGKRSHLTKAPNYKNKPPRWSMLIPPWHTHFPPLSSDAADRFGCQAPQASMSRFGGGGLIVLSHKRAEQPSVIRTTEYTYRDTYQYKYKSVCACRYMYVHFDETSTG